MNEDDVFVFSDVWALATLLSKGRAALAATAPINVRRFIITLLNYMAGDANACQTLSPPFTNCGISQASRRRAPSSFYRMSGLGQKADVTIGVLHVR
jgi:hypothetical protein